MSRVCFCKDCGRKGIRGHGRQRKREPRARRMGLSRLGASAKRPVEGSEAKVNRHRLACCSPASGRGKREWERLMARSLAGVGTKEYERKGGQSEPVRRVRKGGEKRRAEKREDRKGDGGGTTGGFLECLGRLLSSVARS